MKLRSASAIAVSTIALAAISVHQAGAQILLLSTGDSTEDATVQSLLQTNLGQTVTIGPYLQDFDSSPGTTVDPTPYKMVLLMENNNNVGDPLTNAGQTSLVNYVNNGGGTLTTAWLQYYDQQFAANTILDPILPVFKTNVYDYTTSITFQQNTANTTIDNGVPANFTITNADNNGGTESTLTAVPGAIDFYNSTNNGGAALVGGTYGSGKIISFSTLGLENELGDTGYSTLFSNSVLWAEGAQITPPTGTPEPSALAAGIAAGLSSLLLGLRRRRAR